MPAIERDEPVAPYFGLFSLRSDHAKTPIALTTPEQVSENNGRRRSLQEEGDRRTLERPGAMAGSRTIVQGSPRTELSSSSKAHSYDSGSGLPFFGFLTLGRVPWAKV